MKFLAVFAMAAAAAGAAFADCGKFNDLEKEAVRKAAAEIAASLRKSDKCSGRAVTLLPVNGDKDGYAERLLTGALVNSGMTVVMPNDENDVRFKRILASIKWDGRQVKLGSVDTSTVDELGRLRSTQVFIEAVLDIKSEEKSAKADLHVLSYVVATKSYLDAANGVGNAEAPAEPPPPPPRKAWTETAVQNEIVPLRVKVDTRAKDAESEGVARRLDTAVRGALAKLGFRLAGEGCDAKTVALDDVTVTLDVGRSVFDKAGEYEIHEAKVDLSAVKKAGAGTLLVGTAVFDERGDRKLGSFAADRSLAEKLEGPAVEWLKKNIVQNTVKTAAVQFEVRLAKPIAVAGDMSVVEKFMQPFALLGGVRLYRLDARDDEAGMLRFFVVYETEKFPGGLVPAYFASAPELGELLDK